MLTRDNVAGNLAKILNVDSKSEFTFSQDTAYLNLLQRFNKDFLQKSSNLNLEIYKEIIAYEEKMALPFNDSFDGDNREVVLPSLMQSQLGLRRNQSLHIPLSHLVLFIRHIKCFFPELWKFVYRNHIKHSDRQLRFDGLTAPRNAKHA